MLETMNCIDISFSFRSLVIVCHVCAVDPQIKKHNLTIIDQSCEVIHANELAPLRL